MVKRPAQLPPRTPLTQSQIDMATYVGSPEHKAQRWWGGLPDGYVDANGMAHRPGRQFTTICPLVTAQERDMATGWVRDALIAGQTRFYEGDKDFPRRLWYRDPHGQLWTGFCVNSMLGQYKGWPIDEDEYSEVFGRLA